MTAATSVAPDCGWGTDFLGDWSPTAADPAAEVYQRDGHVFPDEMGEVDGQLIRSGIRWTRLRWIHRKRRLELWQEIRAAEMPPGTRTCWEGAEVWLDEVRARIAAQPWQQRRKNTWLSAALLLAHSTRADMRPLTEIPHHEIAGQIRVDPRYVTRIVRWLIAEGLLGKVLGGTRFVPVEIPEDETADERAARLAAEGAAQAAQTEFRRAARAHAHAELAAAEGGQAVPPAELDRFRELREARSAGQTPTLRNLASVYELRLPTPPPAPPETTPAPLAQVVELDPHRRQGAADPREERLTSENPQKFNPNPQDQIDLKSPEDHRHVEKRRAPRGSEHKEVSPEPAAAGPKQTATRQSVAWRTAEALLVGPVDGWCDENVTLPWPLRRGVSRSWLAALVRPLTAAGWTPLELSWHIATAGGRYRMLPARIASPRGLIRASLSIVNPAVRPAVRWAADDVLRDTDTHILRMNEQLTAADARADLERNEAARTRAAERRAAIDACPLCDEGGWLELPGYPDARCTHNPETKGW